MTGLTLSVMNTITYTGTTHEDTAHVHEHAGDFWPEFMALMTSPAHLAFEFVFSLVFDFVIVTLLYGIVIRKVIIPRLRKSLHEELDKEHGVEHHELPDPKKLKRSKV